MMQLTDEKLQLKYIPLDQVVLWDENPKKHDIGALMQSIEKYGYVDPAKFDPNLNGGKGGLVYGNGRSQCVQMIRDNPDKDIDGTEYDESIAKGVELEATFRIKIPVQDADPLEDALNEFLAEFPQARMEKII